MPRPSPLSRTENPPCGRPRSRRAVEAAPTWLDFAHHPIGTGPYKVREFRPNTMLILHAHNEYRGGRPPIRTLRLVEVPEVSARVNGLLASEYHFASDIPPDQIARIEADPAYEVLGGTILNHRLTSFDVHHPALCDPRVRLAMDHAIDRQAIIAGLWAGRTTVPPGLQWEFFGKMLVQGWTVPEFDLPRARDLIRQSGYKGDPIPYRLLNNYYTNQVDTAQVLVEMWREAGLNVAIEMKENWTQIRDASKARAERRGAAGRRIRQRGAEPPMRRARNRDRPGRAASRLRPPAADRRARRSRLRRPAPERDIHRQAAEPAVASLALLRAGFPARQLRPLKPGASQALRKPVG